MSRRGTVKKRPLKYDPIYHNRVVNMLINRIMKHGKKSLAYQIFYGAVKNIGEETKKKNPLLVFRKAMARLTPAVGLKIQRKHKNKNKKKKKSGSIRYIPILIKKRKATVFAIRWLLAASRKRLGKNMALKLSSEIIDAANNKGGAIAKKEESYKIARANKAFAHPRLTAAINAAKRKGGTIAKNIAKKKGGIIAKNIAKKKGGIIAKNIAKKKGGIIAKNIAKKTGGTVTKYIGKKEKTYPKARANKAPLR